MPTTFHTRSDFEQLFKEHYSSLVNYAFRMVKDKDTAEDLCQQVFVSLWEKRETIEIEGNIKSYLLRSTHNACLNHFKHQKVVEQHQQSVDQVEEADSRDILEAEELRSKIGASVKKLPTQCRKVFLMSRLQGKKYAQIAEELEISIKTVENQMGKALKLLRSDLQSELRETLRIVKTIFWLSIGVNLASVVIR